MVLKSYTWNSAWARVTPGDAQGPCGAEDQIETSSIQSIHNPLSAAAPPMKLFAKRMEHMQQKADKI